jgi:hypothetical protein
MNFAAPWTHEEIAILQWLQEIGEWSIEGARTYLPARTWSACQSKRLELAVKARGPLIPQFYREVPIHGDHNKHLRLIATTYGHGFPVLNRPARQRVAA